MENDAPPPSDEEAAPAIRRFPSSRVSPAERERLRENARDVNFPSALRGYDRAAVDRYVEEMNRLIAELEISSSPESAIRHALKEVSEETRGLLEQAHETAAEITSRSRSQADDRLQRAEQEAEEVRTTAARDADETRALAEAEAERVQAAAQRKAEAMLATAEARVAELEHDAEAIWRERRQLLDDVGGVAQRLQQVVEAESARFPRAVEAAPPPDED